MDAGALSLDQPCHTAKDKGNLCPCIALWM